MKRWNCYPAATNPQLTLIPRPLMMQARHPRPHRLLCPASARPACHRHLLRPQVASCGQRGRRGRRLLPHRRQAGWCRELWTQAPPLVQRCALYSGISSLQRVSRAPSGTPTRLTTACWMRQRWRCSFRQPSGGRQAAAPSAGAHRTVPSSRARRWLCWTRGGPPTLVRGRGWVGAAAAVAATSYCCYCCACCCCGWEWQWLMMPSNLGACTEQRAGGRSFFLQAS